MKKNIIIIDVDTDKIKIKNLTNKIFVCKDFKNKRLNEKTFIKLLKKIGVNLNKENTNFFYSEDIKSDKIFLKKILNKDNYNKIINNYYDVHITLEELTSLKKKIHFKYDSCSITFSSYMEEGLKWEDGIFDHLKAHEYIKVLYYNAINSIYNSFNISKNEPYKKSNNWVIPPIIRL